MGAALAHQVGRSAGASCIRQDQTAKANSTARTNRLRRLGVAARGRVGER